MTVTTLAGRYADPFLNALMYSHQIIIRGELWYGKPIAMVGQFNIVSGSVSGDRAGSVRRTADIVADPTIFALPNVEPYGSRIKLFRGIRYPNGAVEEVQVFYGRVESVSDSLDGVGITASDLGADIMDARFLTSPMRPAQLPGAPTKILDTIKALISDVHAGIAFDTALVLPASNTTLVSGTSWAQERGDALDSLCTQLQNGCEWFINMYGTAVIRPLPAVITSGTQPIWIIDSGDEGVLVDRKSTKDRQGVFNGAVVFSEPVGGPTPATNHWEDDGATSPTKWDGPFGRVVQYYTGQQVNSTAAALELAKNLVLNSTASVKQVEVTCVANPKLQLGDVVRVWNASRNIDGMFFVQSLTLPMDPESPMTLSLYSAVTATATSYRDADLLIPEGARWQPIR